MMDQYSNVTPLLWSTLGFLVFLWILKYHWKRRWLYYYGSKINGPIGLPFIGSLYVFYKGRKDIFNAFGKFYNKYKPLMKFWLGSKLLIMPTEPKTIELLTKTFLEKDELYTEYGQPFLGDGLVTLPVSKWKQHKKIILPLFNQQTLNSYMPIFVKHANDLVAKLRTNFDQVELLPYFVQYSVNIAIDSCIGINSCELGERMEYYSCFMRCEHFVFSSATNPLMHVKFLRNNSSLYKEANALREKMWNFIGNIVQKRRKENLEDENNLLTRLIKITDEEGKWTNNELMGEVQTIVAGASETTLTAECFVMLMLAIHPKIQEKVYEEIFTIFGNSVRDITSADLSRLKFLECVIKETLRLYPPIPAILRSVDKNIVVESRVVPKGSTLVVPILQIQRDPKYWHDPLKFNPERFLPEEISKHERYAFLPFSTPPRSCIGYNFAFTAMKTVLATVLRHFELESCQYKRLEDIKLTSNISISATHGYGVTLKPRY